MYSYKSYIGLGARVFCFEGTTWKQALHSRVLQCFWMQNNNHWRGKLMRYTTMRSSGLSILCPSLTNLYLKEWRGEELQSECPKAFLAYNVPTLTKAGKGVSLGNKLEKTHSKNSLFWLICHGHLCRRGLQRTKEVEDMLWQSLSVTWRILASVGFKLSPFWRIFRHRSILSSSPCRTVRFSIWKLSSLLACINTDNTLGGQHAI